MDHIQGLAAGALSVLAGLFAYLRTRKGKTVAWNWVKRLVNVDPSADDLRSSVDNMSLVVDAQGQSISWLTEQQEVLINQLTAYKEELTLAREQLKELEGLHKENLHLKKRVKELEEQVAKLEIELERRRKYTPKSKRSENE
jgi:hypothetical protein